VNLHKEVHGVDDMFGSLDCMHSGWKNCPMVWQGSHPGLKGRLTIILEAIYDFNLWFRHAAFGHAEALADLRMLELSSSLEKLVNGEFASWIRLSFLSMCRAKNLTNCLCWLTVRVLIIHAL
jgi:hypothetical protein